MKRFISILLAGLMALSLVACGSNEVAEASKSEEPTSAAQVEPKSGAYNVKDFGATGDGETDDLKAIQAAIDQASQDADCSTIYFPEGIYLVKEIIVLKSNIVLQLDSEAVILNGISQVNHPSIPFMSGPFTEDGEQVEWEPISNVTIDGGTLDMNGGLNEEGTQPKNLPFVNSTGGFALGYCSDITIKNMTIKNAFNGHAIQLANVTNVLIENCSFEGQSIPAGAKDSGVITKELIQIEPGTIKGFPYAANETKKASSDVVIRNCYFGKSEECGEPVTFIGTHNQVAGVEKCNNITIEGNTFDNPYYCGLRFCGYDNVDIVNNTFISRQAEDSVQKRSGARVMINAYCYNDQSKEPVVPNSNITIKDNVMTIEDNGCRGIRVARDTNAQGTPIGIQIIGNKINANFSDNESGINVYRVEDVLIQGNEVVGFNTGIMLDQVSENVKVSENMVSESGSNHMNMKNCGGTDGAEGSINITTSGNGTFDIDTTEEAFTISVRASEENQFAQWSDGNLESEITVPKDSSLSVTAQFN